MKHQIELEGGRLTVNIDAIQYLDAPKEISEMNRATAKRGDVTSVKWALIISLMNGQQLVIPFTDKEDRDRMELEIAGKMG
jgi:hypothetical protein